MRHSIKARAFPGLPLILGGSAVMIGAVLPWMTLLAGLHSLRGIIGLNGKIFFGLGALCFVAGVVLIIRPAGAASVTAAFGLVGAAMTVAAAWLISGMQAMQTEMSINPMTLAQPGPGLLVAAVGAVMVSMLLLLPAPFKAAGNGNQS